MKDYFDRNAHAWVEAAYAGDVRFPVGAERVRLAIEGVAPAMQEGSRLVDLGCGGGQLCVHAANLGWRAAGVDSAPGMIEEARAEAEGLDVEWIVSSYDVCIDGRRMSVSLMTIELAPAGDGTLLIMTEQGAFFDGLDSSDHREEGALDSLNKLEAHLEP